MLQNLAISSSKRTTGIAGKNRSDNFAKILPSNEVKLTR